MELVIDRFEGDYAILELSLGKFVEIPRELVPDAKEGDIVKIIVNKESTKRRKKEISDLVDNLFI